MRSAWLLVIGGCTGAATSILPVAPPLSAPTAGAAAQDPPARSGPDVGCEFALHSLRVEPDTQFCASGACFAELAEHFYAEVAVRVNVGGASVAMTLESGAARLRGTVRGGDIRIGPKTPTVVDGWILPIEVGSVGIRFGAPGGLQIEVRNTNDLELANAVTALWPCSNVAFEFELATGDLDWEGSPPHWMAATLAGAGARSKATTLHISSSRMPLSREPGGPPVAYYTPEGDTDVEVLERRGSMSRIVARAELTAFAAWVPTSLLVAAPLPGMGAGYSSGRVGVVPARGTQCGHDIPLFARVGNRLVPVGDVVEKASFDVTMDEGRAVVDLRTKAFTAREGVRFEIEARDLEDCR